MEIKEIPIGQDHNDKKKFSPKIREEIQRYLHERGIGKDNLSPKQWEYVARYIAGKKKAKLGLIFYIAGTVFSIGIAFSSYNSLKRVANKIASCIPPETVIIKEDGTRSVIEVDKKVLEYYGKANSLMGFTIGFFLLLGITSFSKIIGCIIQVRMKDKVLETFLPAG